MAAGEALMVALSGFLVVFLMLIILWGIIVMVNKLITAIEKKEEGPLPSFPKESEPEVAAAEETEPQTYGGEIALYDVDEKTAATIMAIISHETKIPLSHLVFRSIRAVE